MTLKEKEISIYNNKIKFNKDTLLIVIFICVCQNKESFFNFKLNWKVFDIFLHFKIIKPRI